MGLTKQAKVIKIYYETVGPVCDRSARYMAKGLDGDGKWIGWAILQAGYEPSFYITGVKPTDPNDMNHVELDMVLALKWEPVDELSTLERMARASLPPDKNPPAPLSS